MSVRRWLLAGFFLFMLICTAISRIYDSITVPKVITETAKQKAVETSVEGSGTVRVGEKHIYPVFAGLRLNYVAAAQGSEVKEGDLLFQYDLDSIREKREILLTEIEQVDLMIQKEQLAQEDYPGISQMELAQRELEMARQELKEEQLSLEEQWKEHEEEQKRLEQEYKEDLERLNDDLWQQQDREWERAKLELETARNSRDREVRAAQKNINELIEEMDQAAGSSDDFADEQEKEEKDKILEQELNNRREELEALQADWKVKIDSAKAQMDLLEDQEERIHAGRTDAQESRKKSYEEKLRQEEEKIKAAQEEQKAFEQAVEKAEWELSIAQRRDEAAQLSQEQKGRISALTVRGLELEKRTKQRQLRRLDELNSRAGEVTAQEDGIVADMELTAGKTASGEELVSLAVGKNQFEAVFLKEEQKLAKGDQIELSIPGTPRRKEVVIAQINLMGEEGIFLADLEGVELAPGSVTSYRCTKPSDVFAKVIPLEGLRRDINGDYCLVARAHPAILGEEFRAERVNVEILYQGSREAAVEGALFAEDEVIVGENQSITEGDRVRVIKGF